MLAGREFKMRAQDLAVNIRSMIIMVSQRSFGNHMRIYELRDWVSLIVKAVALTANAQRGLICTNNMIRASRAAQRCSYCCLPSERVALKCSHFISLARRRIGVCVCFVQAALWFSQLYANI